MNSFYIILTGFLVATSCGLLGCFLILRNMAMLGDAISHAVLPGIVLVFLFTGSKNSIYMLFGAILIGILTTFLIEFFNKQGNLQVDASMGVTFTFLFAIGVVLISVFAGKVDLDQDCVLYGEIAYVPFDLWVSDSGIIFGPRVMYVAAFVLLLVVLFIKIGYRALFITTFDPDFASVIGISTVLWHYLLMAIVSMVTVSSFESVGAILVIALIVVPPATAYLLTEDLKKMLLITCALGLLVSLFGYYLAVITDGSIAGAMATIAGLFFLITFIYKKRSTFSN